MGGFLMAVQVVLGHLDHQAIRREVQEVQKPEGEHLNPVQGEGQVLEDFTNPRDHQLAQEQEVKLLDHLPALGQDYINKVLQDSKVYLIREAKEDFNNRQVGQGIIRLVLSSTVPGALSQSAVQKYNHHMALLPEFLQALADNIPSASIS